MPRYIQGLPLKSSSWCYTKLPTSTPTHSSSATLVTELVNQCSANSTGGFRVGFNAGAYGIGSVTSSSSDPLRTVTRVNDGATYQMRIPDNPPIPVGTDGSVIFYDPSTNSYGEFWQFSRNGSDWKCTWGGVMQNGVSQWDGIWTDGSGVPAAGFAFLGQVTTVDDLTRSTGIGHVIGIANPHSYRYCWPANRTDGHGGQPGNPIKMGQRFRLPANYDVTRFSGVVRKFVEAIRDYGLIIADSTASPSENYPVWTMINGEYDTDGRYDSMFGTNDYGAVLSSLPFSDMVALPDGYGQGITPGPVVTATATNLKTTKTGTSASGDIVTLSWESTVNPTSWTAEITTPGGVKWAVTLGGNERSYDFWNVVSGSTFTVNGGATVATASYPMGTGTPVTATPKINVTASNVTTSETTIDWSFSDMTPVTTVTVAHSKGFSTSTTTKPYKFTGLTAGTAYTFSVTANGVTGSVNSTTTSATADTREINVTASDITRNSVDLSWTFTNMANSPVSILRSDNSVVASNISATSYTVSGLTASTSYTFRVKYDTVIGSTTFRTLDNIVVSPTPTTTPNPGALVTEKSVYELATKINSSLGYRPNSSGVRDIISSYIKPGANINVTPDSSGNSLTITASGSSSQRIFLIKGSPDTNNCPGANIGDWAYDELTKTFMVLEG